MAFNSPPPRVEQLVKVLDQRVLLLDSCDSVKVLKWLFMMIRFIILCVFFHSIIVTVETTRVSVSQPADRDPKMAARGCDGKSRLGCRRGWEAVRWWWWDSGGGFFLLEDFRDQSHDAVSSSPHGRLLFWRERRGFCVIFSYSKKKVFKVEVRPRTVFSIITNNFLQKGPFSKVDVSKQREHTK